MVLRIPDDENAPESELTIAVQAGRFRYPPRGIFGGKDSLKAQFLKNDEPADPSGLTFGQPGDVIAFHSAGGGGYGSPFERDPEDVLDDVRNDYVSIAKAREDYGVAIDPVAMIVNIKETEVLRIRKF
jgi:N-methylhydantoinase B